MQSQLKRLGSDVPFFLKAHEHPSAIVRGLGDVLEPTPLDRTMHLTLILPDLHCQTADVYRKFDEMQPTPTLREIRAVNRSNGLLINDLTEPAFAVEPRLRALRDRCVTALDGRSVHMTGSGAALFTLHEDASGAIQAAARLRERCSVAAVPVRTLDGREGNGR